MELRIIYSVANCHLFIFYATCGNAYEAFGIWSGRGAKEANLYTEIAEGIHSYGITRHRHGKHNSSDSRIFASGVYAR